MLELIPILITPEAFEPFGDVILGTSGSLAPWNGRSNAGATLERLVAAKPLAPDQHVLHLLERHVHSTQAFFPLAPEPYLIVTAQTASDGNPDLTGLRAFVVPGQSVIQYRPAVWHAPLTTLGSGGHFAMHVHKDGSDADCEFFEIPPVAVRLEVAKRARCRSPNRKTADFQDILLKE